MADPHIQSPMDKLDKLTVVIYRSGFILAAIMTTLLPYWQGASVGIIIAAICCAASLHIYMKSFRFLLQMASWIGCIFYLLGYPHIALGGALMTLGGLCFKEYFCFRIFLLNVQPLFVALLWFALQIDNSLLIQCLSLLCALLFMLLAIQKWRMPLHFDIGDKEKYEI